jgi:hypothetical protein
MGSWYEAAMARFEAWCGDDRARKGVKARLVEAGIHHYRQTHTQATLTEEYIIGVSRLMRSQLVPRHLRGCCLTWKRHMHQTFDRMFKYFLSGVTKFYISCANVLSREALLTGVAITWNIPLLMTRGSQGPPVASGYKAAIPRFDVELARGRWGSECFWGMTLWRGYTTTGISTHWNNAYRRPY